MTDKKKKS